MYRVIIGQSKAIPEWFKESFGFDVHSWALYAQPFFHLSSPAAVHSVPFYIEHRLNILCDGPGTTR